MLSNTTGRMGVGIISAGRVGAPMGKALRAAGHSVIGAYATSEQSIDRLETLLPGVPALEVPDIVERSELVVLALPDDELAPLVSGLAELGAWQPGQIVLHTAGRYGAHVLAPATKCGALGIAVHPAMTFTGTSLDVARMQGCPFAVTAPAALQPIGLALVAEMGGEGYIVGEEDRRIYHAALSHGANHLVTLIAQAMRMLENIGIDEPGEFLRPLIHASVEGALSSGETLLTGPIVRGDVGTVQEHKATIDALGTELPDLPAVYQALARATAERSAARHIINPLTLEAILATLSGESGEDPLD